MMGCYVLGIRWMENYSLNVLLRSFKVELLFFFKSGLIVTKRRKATLQHAGFLKSQIEINKNLIFQRKRLGLKDQFQNLKLKIRTDIQ